MPRKVVILFGAKVRCFVGLLLFLAFEASADLRVMTLNAEWLWTPYDQKVDGDKFNAGDPMPADYEQEIAFYRHIVDENQVDILAISEIENEEVARDLSKGLRGNWLVAFKQGRDTATGQDVAILSRLPLVKASVRDFGFPGARVKGLHKAKRLSKLVGARYMYRDSVLSILTAHVLSRRNDSRIKSLRRHAQLKALGVLAREERLESDATLTLGDLNDVLGSPGIDALKRESGLESVFENCGRVLLSDREVRDAIDHIFYAGLTCRQVRPIDLQQHSDHTAILAVFD